MNRQSEKDESWIAKHLTRNHVDGSRLYGAIRSIEWNVSMPLVETVVESLNVHLQHDMLLCGICPAFIV